MSDRLVDSDREAMIIQAAPISLLMQSVNWRQCRGRLLSHKVPSRRSAQLRVRVIIGEFIVGSVSVVDGDLPPLARGQGINCLIIVNTGPLHEPPSSLTFQLGFSIEHRFNRAIRHRPTTLVFIRSNDA